MGINIADNFAYNGKKPMDNRTEYTTLAAMKAVVDANINEGCMCYNKEDGKYYTFKSTNTVDATTGKWREFETGGGGGHTIQDDGVDMTARNNLNFVGMEVDDNSADGSTDVTEHRLTSAEISEMMGGIPNPQPRYPILFDERGTEYQVGWYILANGTKKPVYEKSFNLSLTESVSGAHAFEKNFDISSLSIDELVYAYGVWSRHNSVEIMWYVFGSSESQYGQSTLRLSANKQTMNMLFNSEGTDGQRVILQYTKTTDTPV